MFTLPLKSKIGVTLSVMAMALSLQSCNKDSEQVAPDITAASQSSNALITSGANITKLDLPGTTVSLIAGQYNDAGIVQAVIEPGSGDLLVTYVLNTGVSLITEIHLEVFKTPTEVMTVKSEKFLSGGGAIPGKFQYSSTFAGGVTGARIRIYANELAGLVGASECFSIAAHAVVGTETAWAQLADPSVIPGTKRLNRTNTGTNFPGSNWSAYFNFCRPTTIISNTYVWEDLQYSGNDADYNDLVIQSKFATPTNNEAQITFIAAARGALYDHAFKFKIPKAGIALNSDGSPAIWRSDKGPLEPITAQGDLWVVTVFPSTKDVLPAAGSSTYDWTCNTSPTQSVVTKPKEVMLAITTTSTFSYKSTYPINPFITVKPTTGQTYDLYVQGPATAADLQLPNSSSTWAETVSTAGGNVTTTFPNGVIIPSNWRWPRENVRITQVYPLFTTNVVDMLTQGLAINPAWAQQPTSPTADFLNNTFTTF